MAGWGGEDGAVVADAEAEVAGARGRGALPDGGDKGEFSGGLGDGGHETQNTLAGASFGLAERSCLCLPGGCRWVNIRGTGTDRG